MSQDKKQKHTGKHRMSHLRGCLRITQQRTLHNKSPLIFRQEFRLLYLMGLGLRRVVERKFIPETPCKDKERQSDKPQDEPSGYTSICTPKIHGNSILSCDLQRKRANIRHRASHAPYIY
jgi:hypothetical protein